MNKYVPVLDVCKRTPQPFTIPFHLKIERRVDFMSVTAEEMEMEIMHLQVLGHM